AWQRGLSVNRPSLMHGDFDGDGVVGAADLAIWQAQFGTPGITAASAAVPECGAAALAAAAAACGAGLFRRRTARPASKSCGA
ncbi:MAG TPA: hypothetical protein PKC18_16200, partial [Lacipirellulaceae bacterium]|nr:hypothetical protein [Lacipirellulaceae bacterium]